ncbi:uncharacterized protein LOC114307198 [Camellia sinensis]|uniref:uncharacterized protein LOC114307198 n=1 Tax=Camellia sinensis TaxID=4442 RepID=UPI001035FCE6|nr:uncharacterized protein LOC114307198 [Camellia sinensis]
MYHNLKERFWWIGMKKDIASHVSKFLHCQRVKAEHQRLAGMLQPFLIPEWKWEHITVDFMVGLHQSVLKNEAIWVIVDRLTKSVHFLPIRIMYSLTKFSTVYIKEIIRLHGTPVSIIFDRDPRCVSHFWNKLQKALGTTLKFSTAYHSQIDGYSDTRRRDREFQIGDRVFLKISPTRGVIRFGKQGKLNPRYIGPFEILKRIGFVAYCFALPPELSNVHNMFHISMLHRYPEHVVDYENLEVQEDLSYEEQFVQILDRRDQILRNKTIPLVKVLWRNHRVEEATWETESQMQAKYPHLFEK